MAKSYHGYGKKGYIPGPYHGRLSNRDWARFAQEARTITGNPRVKAFEKNERLRYGK